MKCEHCGKEHNGNYGSGKFCSRRCQASYACKVSNQKRHQKFLNDLYRTCEGYYLDVTNNFVEEYKNTHPVCEICGCKEIKVKRNQYYKGNNKQALCVDHSHKTHKFRGVLCHNCNIRLGWLEKHREEALKYLDTRG